MNPFIGEIRLFAFNFAPANDQGPLWQLCDGSLLKISDYTPLFALLGTTYGGDGQTTFGVPDLRTANPLASSNFGAYYIALQGIFPPRS
jgi:microcystin-dependent protein